MMSLHHRVNQSELTDYDRFDFLANCAPAVLRMDEVHPSADNDGHYLYLIWVRPEDTARIRGKIESNVNRSSAVDCWTTRILPDTGEGLIIVSTWL